METQHPETDPLFPAPAAVHDTENPATDTIAAPAEPASAPAETGSSSAVPTPFTEPPPAPEPAETAPPTEAVTTTTLFTETIPVAPPPAAEPADSTPPTEAVTTTTLFTETVPVSPPPAPAETGASSVPPEKTINPDDINPLVPAWQLLQEEISPAVAAASAVSAEPEEKAPDEPPLYTQSEYDKLYQRYQEQKARADALKDSFFACADVMYEMLAYLNASRLYHGKDAVMASDINGIVENNPILNAIANDLRQTSIESGIGIVSELPESQEHLREHVMNVWRTRMAEPGERDRIHAQLFTHRNIPDGEELF